MSEHSVLHIGFWAPPVTALVGLGVDVSCVVTAKDAPAVRAAGAAAIVVPDPTSVDGILAGLARSSLGPADFTVVCSGIEFCLVQAAAVAELGGARTPGHRRMIAMRDKFVQKEIVRAAGIATARCDLVERLDETFDHDAVRYPAVLKPLDGAGAKHTIVVHGPEELRAAAAAVNAAQSGPWLLEDYVAGEEFFADGVVRDGVVTLLSVSRYLQNLIEVHEGGMVGYHAVPEEEAPELYARTRALTEASLKALGHEDGVFHLEVFWDGTAVVFGECAARVGGGRADRLVELTFGVNLHEEWARAALGLPSQVAAEPVRSDRCYGGLNLRSPKGTLLAVPSAADVEAQPGVVQAEVLLTPGDVSPDFSTASNIRAGQAVVWGAGTRATEERIKELDSWFFGAVRVQS